MKDLTTIINEALEDPVKYNQPLEKELKKTVSGVDDNASTEDFFTEIATNIKGDVPKTIVKYIKYISMITGQITKSTSMGEADIYNSLSDNSTDKKLMNIIKKYLSGMGNDTYEGIISYISETIYYHTLKETYDVRDSLRGIFNELKKVK